MEFINSFKDLAVSVKDKILVVELNRPKSLNAISDLMFQEFKILFKELPNKILKHLDIRCVILKGKNGNFSSGLDLKSEIVMNFGGNEDMDIGRKAFWFKNMVDELQLCLSSIEMNPLPVISCIDGFCLGGATSIISCCDMRFCTLDTKFSIREIEIGLTADIGVLQRFGKQIGNDSLFRQYCYTGEIFNGKQALEFGLVNKVFNNTKEMEDHVYALASTICEKSPIVLYGIKKVLNFSRDNNVNASLEMVGLLNSAMAQSQDIITAVTATLKKEKKVFPKF